MPDINDILHSLKEHSVLPPAGNLETILKSLEEIKSPGVESNGLNQLSRLHVASVPPPSFLLDNIVSAVSSPVTSPVVRMPRTYLWGVAAAVIVAATAWGIYKFTGTKKEIPTELATAPPATETRPFTPPPVPVADKTATAADHGPLAGTHRMAGKKHIPTPVYTASVDGYDFPVSNNDLLVSFASFNYNNLPAFITSDETAPVEIRIDQSTSITVSEGMVSMMKTMYKTKRNGKPTFNAKRTKKRIEKWKASDAKFFDKNPGKNPMDPFDLAEFIF